MIHPLTSSWSRVLELLLHCALFQACLVGIVVPDPDFLPMWLKKKGIEGSYSELCKNKVRLAEAHQATPTAGSALHAHYLLTVSRR